MHFVVIASPRTGSSHLVNVLGAHPEILCNGNVYHPNKVWVFWPKEDLDSNKRAKLEEIKQTAPFALLDLVYSTSYGRPHVGFKIFEGQNDDVLYHLIKDSEVKKIVLYRDNVLANYASKLAARRTGQWAVMEGSNPAEPGKVAFRADRFISFCNEYNRFYRKVFEALLLNGQTFHLIKYSEVNNPYSLYALLEFIGADPQPAVLPSPQSRKQVKQNSSDILSRFSNPDVARSFLRETGNLHWAHEGELSFEDMASGENVRTQVDAVPPETAR